MRSTEKVHKRKRTLAPNTTDVIISKIYLSILIKSTIENVFDMSRLFSV